MQSDHTFTIEFWHRPINKNNLIQTMTTYTKRDTNERKDINPKSIAHRFRTHRNPHIYLGAKFSSRIMRVYRGGFRLAIMRVYICGKIFALHNTHIKHGENPKIIMRKTVSNP